MVVPPINYTLLKKISFSVWKRDLGLGVGLKLLFAVWLSLFLVLYLYLSACFLIFTCIRILVFCLYFVVFGFVFVLFVFVPLSQDPQEDRPRADEAFLLKIKVYLSIYLFSVWKRDFLSIVYMGGNRKMAVENKRSCRERPILSAWHGGIYCHAVSHDVMWWEDPIIIGFSEDWWSFWYKYHIHICKDRGENKL